MIFDVEIPDWVSWIAQDAQSAAGDAITPGCTMLEIAKAIREAL